MKKTWLVTAALTASALAGCREASPAGRDGGLVWDTDAQAPNPPTEMDAGDATVPGEWADGSTDASADAGEGGREPGPPTRVSAPLPMRLQEASQSLIYWLPDASGLLLEGPSNATEASDLYVYDLEGDALRTFDLNPHRLYSGATRLGQNSQIANGMLKLIGGNNQSETLYEVAGDGTVRELAKTAASRIRGAAWLPNGHDFLYVTDEGSTGALFLHTDAGTQTLASGATGVAGAVDMDESTRLLSANGQRVVYLETDPPMADPVRLCSVRLDGTDRRVISGGVNSRNPGCSPRLLPDGRVLFTAKRQDDVAYELYSAAVDGSQPRRLSPGSDGWLWGPGNCTLMPDGQSVAFSSGQKLYVSALSDGNAKLLTSESPADFIAGTPWGILFSSSAGGLLLASSPDTAPVVVVPAINRPAGVTIPPLVAAGAGRILFRERVDTFDVAWFSVKPDGTDRRRLDAYANSDPSSALLTADGQWAVYPSVVPASLVTPDLTGTLAVIVMAKTDGSGAQWVGPATDRPVLLHPETGWFAFEKTSQPSRYAIARVGSGTTRDIPAPAPFNGVDLKVRRVNDARTTFQADEDRDTPGTESVFHVVRREGATASGQRFSFAEALFRKTLPERGPTDWEAVLRPTNLATSQPFAYLSMSLIDGTLIDVLPPGQFVSGDRALLAPDETRVVMGLGVAGPDYDPPYYEDVSYQLWSNAVQGGAPTKLSAGLQLTDLPSVFTPDGQHVVFGAQGKLGMGTCEGPNLFAANVDGSALAQLTPANGPCFAPSFTLPTPDNARVAVFANRTDIDATGVFVVDLDGANWHAIAPASGDTQAPVSDTTPWPQLTPDGERLIYRSRTGTLYSAPLDGAAAPVLLLSSLPNSQTERVVFSDDGSRVGFVQSTALTADFYLTSVLGGGRLPLLEPFSRRSGFIGVTVPLIIGHDRGRSYVFHEQGIVEVNLDAGTSRVVLPLGAEVDVQSAALVPERNQLVIAADYETDELQSLYVLDLTTLQMRRLLPTRARGYAVSGIWNVPGQDFVFVQMDGLERGIIELFTVTLKP